MEACEQNRDEIRLLLTDLMLPGGMNGKQLARQLLKEKPALKVIYMSGYSAEIATNVAASDVKFAYLAKPFELDTLAETVERSLSEASRATAS